MMLENSPTETSQIISQTGRYIKIVSEIKNIDHNIIINVNKSKYITIIAGF